MHFDNSVESTADSDLEDGELTEDAGFTIVCPRSFRETRCNGPVRERSAQFAQKKRLRSHSSDGEEPSRCIASSEQGNLIKVLCSETLNLNQAENKFDRKKNVLMEKSSPKYSNPKYAHNGRNEELKNNEEMNSQCKN